MLSSKSQQLKRMKRLGSQAQARRDEGVMLVEGPTLVVEALASRLGVEAVYAEEGVILPPELETFDVVWTMPGALRSVVSTVSPQPLVAVVATHQWTVEDLDPSKPVLVIVEGRDPGNIGTLWRTAEAAGFAGIVLTGNSVDPTNPKVIRASAGAAFRLPVVVAGSAVEIFGVLRDQGRSIFATALRADSQPHDTVDLRTAAIVLGNEAHGLPAELLAAADAVIRIELAGPTESLNVAAAGAVLCFEALRQARSHNRFPIPLDQKIESEE